MVDYSYLTIDRIILGSTKKAIDFMIQRGYSESQIDNLREICPENDETGFQSLIYAASEPSEIESAGNMVYQ